MNTLDQTTTKIVWTQEANQECEEKMNSKMYFLNNTGGLIRYIELESIQTWYNLTKESKNSKELNSAMVSQLCSKTPDEFTFEYITELLGCYAKDDSGDDGSRFSPEDKMTIPVNGFCGNKEPIKTTLGRFIFNKLIIEKTGFYKELGYINQTLDQDVYNAFEANIANMLLLDKITVKQMYTYCNVREWASLQLHAVITPSFTEEIIKVHPDVQKMKNELFEKNKKALEAGDAKTASDIEAKLIAKTKESFKDNPGMDLYNSGARGSIGNNYKNMYLMRGAVYNRANHRFEVVKNALDDGLAREDIPISANTILEGAFPKAVYSYIKSLCWSCRFKTSLTAGKPKCLI